FVILKNCGHCHTMRALASLELERNHCMRYENEKEISIRSLVYGVIESLHMTLLHLIEKKNQEKSSVENSITGGNDY
ncbi:hypothetical protein PMAYCL1PPCAC_13996, partial [Pristionchus mayeri]